MFKTEKQFILHPWKNNEELQGALMNKYNAMFSDQITVPEIFDWCSNNNWEWSSKNDWTNLTLWVLDRFKHETEMMPRFISTATNYAAKNSDIDYFKLLLDKGFKEMINIDDTLRTALIHDQIDFCNMLLENNYIDKSVFTNWECNKRTNLAMNCLWKKSTASLNWIYENFEFQVDEYDFLLFDNICKPSLKEHDKQTIEMFDWFIKYYPYSIEKATEKFKSMFKTEVSIPVFKRMMYHYPHLKITDELFLTCTYYPLAEWIVSLYPEKYEVRKEYKKTIRRSTKLITIPLLKNQVS